MKVMKIEEDQSHYNVESDYTVKSFEDKIREINTSYETQIRVLKDAHTSEVRQMDA
jgi:hypothetical protein